MRWLAATLVIALTAPAAAADGCAGLAESFDSRLALSRGAMDEDGAFVLLLRGAEADLRACPELEPQRYAVARLAELGYSAGDARRANGPDPHAKTLTEAALRAFPRSARIATVAARLDGSVEFARRAVMIDPDYAPARVALAVALAASGDARGALAMLPASGQPASTLIARARISLAAGDARATLADALAAGKATPRELEPMPGRDAVRDKEELLGLSLRALGRPAEARRRLESAASLGSAAARRALEDLAAGQ
jgi:hypothetical protein